MGIVMLKKCLFTVILLSLAACTALSAPTPTPSAQQMDVEEQVVYAALIKDMFPADMVVIMDTTATDAGGTENTTQTLQYALNNMYGVSPQTSDSFLARNDKAYPFRADMQLGLNYVLLSSAELNAIFDVNQDGWQVFYEHFPQARSILTFSRVGFDAALDQALVYAGDQSQVLESAGNYILLKKVNRVWNVDQKVKLRNQ